MTDILLIEDNDDLAQELQIILRFLGESAVRLCQDKWREALAEQALNGDQIKMVLVGDYEPQQSTAILTELANWHEGLPLIYLYHHQPLVLTEPVATRVVAGLSLPLQYQPVLDGLHKAQVYGEHYSRLRDLASVRDYNVFHSLVGDSSHVQQIRQIMSQVADTEVTVLITGESGTGKEVVARNLHANSGRSEKPFVPINCGAIPPDLLESELFGHEKGAFTGAISTRVGRFELAEGGTLFLDEIGDMPLPMQVKLLRVIQEQSYERVGGTRTLKTNVRILAATHRNLEDMITAGSFRQDLYYRLNVFPIEMPSLRERASDIPFLLNELIGRLESSKRGSVRFNSAAIRALMHYQWPGNVRELANLVERMAILHPHGVVGVKDLPKQYQPVEMPVSQRSMHDSLMAEAARYPGMSDASQHTSVGAQAHCADTGVDAGDHHVASMMQEDSVESETLGADPLLPLNGLDLKEYLSNLEKSLIEQALNDCDGVVARAADRLSIRRTTLVEKMRKYEMQRA
jgi:sigma-54 specific flagellar transcriptional regulator A